MNMMNVKCIQQRVLKPFLVFYFFMFSLCKVGGEIQYNESFSFLLTVGAGVRGFEVDDREEGTTGQSGNVAVSLIDAISLCHQVKAF